MSGAKVLSFNPSNEDCVREQELFAVSLGSKVASMLRENQAVRAGKIHSVFSKALNVLISNDSLVSIVDLDVGRGPFNVVVRLPEMAMLDGFHIKSGQDVHASRDLLEVGDLRINIQESPLYTSKHNFSNEILTQVSDIEKNISRMRRVVSEEGHFQGLAPILCFQDQTENQEKQTTEDVVSNQSRSNYTNFFSRESLATIDFLLRSIESCDIASVKKYAGSLVGLGPGLTPAADDLLCGFMLAYYLFTENMKGDLQGVRKNNQVIAGFSYQTTLLSSSYLKQAAIGDGTETAVSLIEKLLTSRLDNDVEGATRRLLAIGASSGTDSAIGIILGSKMAMKTFLKRNSR
jgi:hypothetical protein